MDLFGLREKPLDYSKEILACPKCSWHTDTDFASLCTCYDSFHPFKTKAKCQYCSKQWSITYCPKCRLCSLHTNWYPDQVREITDEEEALLIKKDGAEAFGTEEYIKETVGGFYGNGR